MCVAYATVQECYSIGHVSVHIQFVSSTVTLTSHDWLNQDHLQEKFFENKQSAHCEFSPIYSTNFFHEIFFVISHLYFYFLNMNRYIVFFVCVFYLVKTLKK